MVRVVFLGRGCNDIGPICFSIGYTVYRRVVFLNVLVGFLCATTTVRGRYSYLFTIFSSRGGHVVVIVYSYLGRFTLCSTYVYFSGLRRLLVPVVRLLILMFLVPMRTSSTIQVVYSQRYVLVAVMSRERSKR